MAYKCCAHMVNGPLYGFSMGLANNKLQLIRSTTAARNDEWQRPIGVWGRRVEGVASLCAFGLQLMHSKHLCKWREIIYHPFKTQQQPQKQQQQQ